MNIRRSTRISTFLETNGIVEIPVQPMRTPDKWLDTNPILFLGK
jgi:hypothetical protein